MILYFLRHADAVEGSPDEQRPLSDKGREQSAAMAKLLKRLDVDIAHLFTSPRLRSRQTAQYAAEALNIEAVTRTELDYGFNVQLLQQILSPITLHDSVMLVGHQPTLTNTIQSVTGARVDVKKCGLARVDVVVRQPLKGELVWLLAPKVVRAIVED